jgi:conjugal transfer pilus assembly protein TraB
MSNAPLATATSTRRRQYLLLGGIAALTGGAALLSVSITSTDRPEAASSRPKSTNILTPGAQVDPRDAWRGQADAQLKSIEQKSREIGQRNAELEAQNKAMLERLKKLEEPRLTPLPPPPVAAPPVRPNFGPDPQTPTDRPALAQLPPPPPPRPMPSAPASTPGNTSTAPSASGIVSITLAEPANAKGTKKTDSKPAARDTRRYLPSGSFVQAVLLGGLDAPTGGQAQRNPQPVLLRLSDHAVLPNHFRARVKECFVVGAGYGDVSAERAYIRTESLSCVLRDGSAIDVPIKGYIAGEDGKAGLRGRLVSKQGQILANALLAGIAGGIGSAFQQQSTTFSVSPLGTTSTTDPGRQLETGIGSGVGKALDRLAGYYINLAEKTFPVVEIDAGRTVDVILTQGIALHGVLDEADASDTSLLAQRKLQPRKHNDDE